MGEDFTQDEIQLVGDIFHEFVDQPDVAENLLDMALVGAPPNLELLARRFDDLEYDRGTLSVDFEEALSAFHQGLTSALVKEASQSDSLLTNRVNLGRVLAIQALLQQQQHSLANISDQLRRLEVQGGQAVYNIFMEQASGIAIGPHATVKQNLPSEGQELLRILGTEVERIVEPSAIREAIYQVLYPVLSPTRIHQACQSITTRLASVLTRGRAVIPREHIRAQMDDFLASSQRYSLLLGPSSTGKSIVMAVEAQRLLENGWTALLMRGGTFSLSYLAERVAKDGLSQPVAPDWRQVVVEPWRSELPESAHGFVLMVDGVDEADPDHMMSELLKLHNAVGVLPPARFKLVLSCRDFAWERLNQQLSFLSDIMFLGQNEAGGVQIIEVTDFVDQELDRALQAVEATELLTPRQPGEWADAHVEAVRELLKHPATFGLYADLHASGDVSSIQNLTWSWLIGRHIDKALGKTRARCHIRPDALRDQLIDWTSLARQHGSRDFYVGLDVVKEALRGLKVEVDDPTQSPYAALLEVGVLVEQPAPGAKQVAGFRFTDVGNYLLSFVLERQAEGKSPGELRALATEWVEEAFNYPPVLDAMLAWIDRLAAEPRNPLPPILLDALIESHSIRTEVVFRLVEPRVVRTLLEVVREKEPGHSFGYREAAKALRASPQALEEIRRYLYDRHPELRQFATELVDSHRDIESIPILIELLEDDDEGVRAAAYTALGDIGEPSVALLLPIVRDASQPTARRIRYLGALRVVGFRDDQVSVALTTCLTDGQTGDTALLRNGLWAAADLRDVEQTSYAIAALGSLDQQTVYAAARCLAEVPAPEALPALREALQRWQSPEEDPGRLSRVPRQLLVALAKAKKDEATDIVLKVLTEGLQDRGELSPTDAISAAGDLDLPAARVLILENLTRRLQETPPAGMSHSLRQLGGTWQPDHMAALVEATRRLADQGVDLSKRLVDEVIQGRQADGEHPLRSHHVQGAALHTLVKCQAPNFVTEASRLLLQAGQWFDLEICDALWVVADPQAEEALLQKLEQTVSEDESAWFQRSRVIRALGTCGTERGASAVLTYLRTEPTILIDLPEEAICPLVRRGVLRTDQLADLARDPRASVQGRTASLIVLGTLGASDHKDLFREIAAESEGTTLRAYAVRMLGFARDPSVAPDLQQLLRSTKAPFVAEQAAEALARLDARQAVCDIERALDDFAETERASGFATALGHFGEPSSLRVLRDALDRSRHPHVRQEIAEALGVYLPDPRAKQMLLERLESWGGGNMDMGDQRPAIRALARHDPQLLLQRACRLYDAGRLDRSTRQELTLWIPHLTQAEGVDTAALIGLLKRLICDRHVPVREMAAQALGRVEPALCYQVYEELCNGPDEWSQACAVYTLGFWNSDEDEIQSARYASAASIRHAADVALEMRRRRRALQQLAEQYRSGDGLARLAAYLSIKEHGDEQTIWTLRNTVRESDLAHTFIRQLTEDVRKRLQNERRKRKREEKNLLPHLLARSGWTE